MTDMTILTTEGQLELDRVMINLAVEGISDVLLPIGEAIREAAENDGVEVRFRHRKDGSWFVRLRKFEPEPELNP
jgi:hypothetical protein